MKWSDEQIETLKQRWADDVTARQIARELEVSRNAVLGMVHRLKLPTHKKSGIQRKPRAPRRVGGRKAMRSAGIQHRIVVRLHEPEPTPVDDAAIPFGQRRTLLELTNHTCRWPVGDGADVFFCGAPADLTKGQPYCPAHTMRAYQAGRAPKPFIPMRSKAA